MRKNIVLLLLLHPPDTAGRQRRQASSAAASAVRHSSTRSAASRGRRHRSSGVKSVGIDGHVKRWTVLCPPCPHKGQRGSSAAPISRRYSCRSGHFPALSCARVRLATLLSCCSERCISGACAFSSGCCGMVSRCSWTIAVWIRFSFLSRSFASSPSRAHPCAIMT